MLDNLFDEFNLLQLFSIRIYPHIGWDRQKVGLSQGNYPRLLLSHLGGISQLACLISESYPGIIPSRWDSKWDKTKKSEEKMLKIIIIFI